MKKYYNFSDERQYSWCAFCGGGTETKDHIPSKVFLDKPFPADLATVSACDNCNKNFSKDEEYIACWLAQASSLILNIPLRAKVNKIFRARPSIKNRIVDRNGNLNAIEKERMENILYKLSAGHSLFDLNEPQFTEPSSISFCFIQSLKETELEEFMLPPIMNILPEIGSQEFQRIFINGKIEWRTVQENTYKYLAYVSNGIVIRIIFYNSVACQIEWH